MPAPATSAPPATTSRTLLPALATLVTVLLWASAFVAIRHVGAEVSPGALTLGRLAVGSVALGALLLVRRPAAGPGAPRTPASADTGPVGSTSAPTRGLRHLDRTGRLQVAVVGVLWFAVYNLALNAAELRVDAGTAAMLVNTGPVLLALLAGVALGEGFPRPLLVGGAIGLAGVVVIGVATSGGEQADVWGVVLCVVAATGYAVAVLAQKPLLRRLSALEVTWAACTVGAVVCLPFAPALVADLRGAGPSALLQVLYLGLFPTAVAFTTWAYALARTSAGRLAATTYLVPPIAVLLGWVLLDETPPGLALVGGALCLVGVAVTRRGSRGR